LLHGAALRIRRTEVRPICNRRAISALLTPARCSFNTWLAWSAAVCGRPKRFPFSRAWARPARTRSRRISRSNSAYCGELQYAEFERAMLKERTKAGLDAARQEGRVGGRRPKLSPQQQAEIRKMVSKGRKTAADAARLFKIHPATVSRLLAQAYAK
jgi:DNA-binding CsgD family transcriptional regulator